MGWGRSEDVAIARRVLYVNVQHSDSENDKAMLIFTLPGNSGKGSAD